jgi:pimeloyl-ACP methyl ester carboxylesterase
VRTALCALALTLAACGSASGEKPKPTILLMPGSGYRGADVYDGARMAIGESTWRRWGFRVKVVPYGPGKAGRTDVLTAVHAERKRNLDGRLCLYGESSGGTWAMVAAAHERVDCVIAGAAPADEDTWLRSKRRVARTFAHRIWPAYFGTGEEDDAFEPYDVWRERKPAVPLLLVVARNDPTVPPDQGGVMNRLPHTRLRVLRSGDAPFVHSRVDATQLGRVQRQLRAFARP